MKKLLFFVMFVVVLCLTLCGFKVTTAATTTTSDLISVEGAQVRLEGSAGIRFVGKINDSFDPTGVTAYGISIAFGEANKNDVVIGGTANGMDVLSAQVSETTEDGNFYINLINIPEKMYGQKVTARSYFVKNDETIYSSTTTVRSLGQVTLAVKNAGQTSELIESIFTVLSTKYMKAYPVGEYYYINNAVYEYEPTVLAKYFLEDYNEVMGTSLTTLVGYANNTRGKTYQDAATKATIQANALYQFFNANNKAMVEKWGWLVSYISDVANNQYVTAQANYVIGATELADSNASWWECRHFLARFEGFFTRAKVSTGFPNLYEFNDNTEYPGLIETINNLENKYLATGDSNLVYIGEKISTELVEKEGYTLSGYTIGSTEYQVGDDYSVTSTPVVITPKFTPIKYNITYMNGEDVITSLSSTYTVEDTVTLPTEYSFGDCDVYSWYESVTLEGEAVTTIPAGTTGDKVYYASTGPVKYKTVDVVFDVNGGTFNKYNSYDDAVEDFLNDFNTFFKTQESYNGTTYTADTLYAAGAWDQPIGAVINFFYNATYKAKWSWLIDYIATVASDANKSAFVNFYNYTKQGELNAANTDYIYCISYEIRAWVGQAKYSKNSNFVTADYSTDAIQNGFLELVRGKVNYQYKDPCTMPKPTMNGATFIGWKSSIDGQVFSGYPGYYVDPGTITYTAIWKYESVMIGNKVYASLSAAVSAANAGDTINVPAGTYSDALTISKANITISGANSGIIGGDFRSDESIMKGAITVNGVSGVTISGCELSGGSAKVILAPGTSNFTFEYNVLNNTSYAAVHLSDTTGTVTNIKVNNNYSSSYGGTRVAGFDGTVNGLEMKDNQIIANSANFDFLHANGTVKGNVIIEDNLFANSAQSFIYVKYVGVINASIKNNNVSNVANVAIDFRNMKENGANSFVITNNVFTNVAVNGWNVIRIRTADYDANDSIYVLVENNQFIDAYYLEGTTYQFVENPSYDSQTAPFKAIYTIGRNYYEINGVAYTSLTAANFANAAISFEEAYATKEEVPGF